MRHRRHLFRNTSASRTFSFDSGNPTFAPDLASLTITGQAPLVSISITPGVASLVLTTQDPTAIVPVAFISWANLSIPGAPGAVAIPVDSAALTISSQTPTIVGGTLLTQPGNASLVLTAQTPTASRTTTSISIIPAAQSLTVTPQSVTISNGIGVPTATNTRPLYWAAVSGAAGYHVGYGTVSGTYGTIVDVGNVTTYTLTLTNGTYYVVVRPYDSAGTPGAWSSELTFVANGVVVSGQTPTRYFTNIRDPAVVSLTITGQVPVSTVRADSVFTPSETSLTVTGQAPTAALSAHQYITVGVGSLTVSPQTPTLNVTGNWWITPPVNPDLLITGQVPIATVAEPNVALPSNGALLITGQAPSLSYDFIFSPDKADLSISGQAFTIFVGDPKTAQPDFATLTLESQDLAVVASGQFVAVPTTADLVIDVFAPIPFVSGVSGQRPAGGSRGRGRPRAQKRWVLPDGTHVYATQQEAEELAKQLTDRPVVSRPEKPKRPVVVKTSDGVNAIAQVIYPVERLGQPITETPEIARTQVAPVPEITYAVIEGMIRAQRIRRKKAVLLLMG